MANLFWPHKPRGSKKRRSKRRQRSWAAAARDAPEVLVLSHGNCLDGITSAVIVQRSFTGVSIAYAQPSQVPHALAAFATAPGEGKCLIIADLSLQPNDLPAIVAAVRRLHEGGWHIEWLDHHHKQWEGLDLGPLEEHLDALVIDRKQAESGATLVQHRYAPTDKALKRLAETVRDRDLWWNKDPASETLEFALTELGPTEFARHIQAYETGPVADEVVVAAAQRERARQQAQAGRILSGTRYYGAPPHRVAVVYGWLPRNTGLHELLQGDCVVAANIRPNAKMSIRSQKGADVCHQVAARFGGGGHPNASGADLGLSGPSYWMYVLRRGRGMDRRVGEAALAELGGT